MNIYAQEGHKVIPSFKDGKVWGGHDHEQEEASKYLKEGIIYTVERTVVHNWSSEVYLKEFPGKAFNTVQFSDYPKPSELWDVPAEAYDAADHLLQEMGTGEEKEDQDELWNKVVAKVAAADIMKNVKPSDNANKLIDWKKSVIEELKSIFTITRK